jgi:aspartate aminotransferase-like enzyme
VTLNAKEIVAEARRIAPDIIVGVDVVTSLATQEFRMDEWQIDVAIAGIQKGLGCPPGLACVAVNDRAERCIAAGDRRIYALDLRRILTDQQNGLFTWTAPTSLVAALATSVDLLLDDGLRTRWKHHARLASMIRSEAQEHGWQEFGDGATSSVVALTLANADEVRSTLAQEFGLVVAGGQDRLKNSIIRIGTMGNLTEEDIIEVLDALNTIMDRA